MSRVNVIRLLAFGMLLVLPAASRAEQSPSIAEQIAKTYGLDSLGKSRPSGTPGMLNFLVVKTFSTSGNGARRPTRSPTRAKTRQAIRSRSPISARSSTAKAMP